MNRRLSVSVSLFLFFFSPGIVAKDNPKIVKQLVYAQPVPKSWSLAHYPSNYMVDEFISEDKIMTFHVPASPSSETIFFETWSATNINWTTWNTRIVHFGVWFRVISPYIPDGIELELGMGCANWEEKNGQGYIDYSYQRFPRSLKIGLNRESIGWWYMYYRDTCQLVPDELAIPILNDLINKGFDVEVNTEARGAIFTKSKIQGAEYIKLLLMVEVTGISKN